MLAEDKPKIREGTPPLTTPVIAPMIPPANQTNNVGPIKIQPAISWDKLPADFMLPDEPVDNIHQSSIVLEFLSATDGTEYSMKPDNPMGKWYFYERVLKVPYYGIFEPMSGDFQMYVLHESGHYDRLPIEESGRYWIEPMQLAIAAWKGYRHQRMGDWLRFWDAAGVMLPWASENQALKEAEAERERQRADRLAQQLRDLGIDPEG